MRTRKKRARERAVPIKMAESTRETGGAPTFSSGQAPRICSSRGQMLLARRVLDALHVLVAWQLIEIIKRLTATHELTFSLNQLTSGSFPGDPGKDTKREQSTKQEISWKSL